MLKPCLLRAESGRLLTKETGGGGAKRSGYVEWAAGDLDPRSRTGCVWCGLEDNRNGGNHVENRID